MAAIYSDNINYVGNKPNFERDRVKTLAQLLAEEPAKRRYPFGHIVFCEEDNNHYKFNYNYENPSSTQRNDVTGWFEKVVALSLSQTTGDNTGAVMSQAAITAELKKTNNEIAEHSTVRFNRIEENVVEINKGEIGIENPHVVYYKPENIFVAVDNSGNYWDTWNGMGAYMSGGKIREDKVYLCGVNAFINDDNLVNLVDSIKKLSFSDGQRDTFAPNIIRKVEGSKTAYNRVIAGTKLIIKTKKRSNDANCWFTLADDGLSVIRKSSDRDMAIGSIVEDTITINEDECFIVVNSSYNTVFSPSLIVKNLSDIVNQQSIVDEDNQFSETLDIRLNDYVRGKYIYVDGTQPTGSAFGLLKLFVNEGEKYRIHGLHQTDGSEAKSIVYALYSSTDTIDNTTLLRRGPYISENYEHTIEVPKDGVMLVISAYWGKRDYITVSKIVSATEKEKRNKVNNILKIPKFNHTYKLINDFKAYDVNNSPTEDFDVVKNNYMLPVPGMTNNFNIRFEFRLEEDILRNSKSGTIFKIQSGDANATLEIKANPTSMTQQIEAYEYEGVEGTSYWPFLSGGISFDGNQTSDNAITLGQAYPFDSPDSAGNNTSYAYKQNIGNIAFSVRYLGDPTSTYVRMSNNGATLTIRENETLHTFDYTEYPLVQDLYNAINNLDNFSCDYVEMEGRSSTELVMFNNIRLTSKYYRRKEGSVSNEAEKELFDDAAPIFIRYAVSQEWHTVEIVRTKYTTSSGTEIDAALVFVDGMYRFRKKGFTWNTDCPTLIFGDNTTTSPSKGLGVIFRNIEIDRKTQREAEVHYFNAIPGGAVIISDYNPYICILEGHGMSVDSNNTDHGDLTTNPNMLETIFKNMRGKGYQSVTLEDIHAFYTMNKKLPKRCFCIIFDDWVWNNFLDLKKRSVFTRNAVKAYISTWANIEYSIKFNEEEISFEKAVEIGKNAGFGVLSHTRDHRPVIYRCPSKYAEEWRTDVYEGDKKGLNPNVLVYPGGRTNSYHMEMLEAEGAELALSISRPYPNIKATNRYALSRINIQNGVDLETIIDKIP